MVCSLTSTLALNHTAKKETYIRVHVHVCMQPLFITCSYDFLGYTGSRYYAYIESYDASSSSIALLNINVTSVDADCFCVQLHYHMLGVGIGALAVLSVKSTGGFTIEWGEGGGTYDVKRAGAIG